MEWFLRVATTTIDGGSEAEEEEEEKWVRFWYVDLLKPFINPRLSK